MDKRLAGLVGLSVLVVILASACSVTLQRYEIRNLTPATIKVSPTGDCSGRLPSRPRWVNVAPGRKYQVVSSGCPLIGDAEGHVVFKLYEGGIYEDPRAPPRPAW